MNGAAADRPLVGLFGAFDTGDLGEVALRRVLERELLLRRPDVAVVALAPFGAERPIPGDEGRAAMPLPLVAGGRSLHLDALIITGDVLADDTQWAGRYAVPADAMAERGVADLVLTGKRGKESPGVPVEWFAVAVAGGDVDVTGLTGLSVWARDPDAFERFGRNVGYSGDPLLLAGRVFVSEALRRRAELLRMCGALPAGRWILIETAPGLGATPHGEHLSEAVAAALRGDAELSVVVATLNPTLQSVDAEVQVPGLIAERLHHLPAWAGLDDIAAAMSGSAAVVATTSGGAHIAASLGIPVAAMAIDERQRFAETIPMIAPDTTLAVQALLNAGLPAAIDRDVRNVDEALTAVASRLPHSTAASRSATAADAVQPALAILQQRLVDERTALQAELSRLQAEIEHLQAAPEHRIARPIREGYRRWQRRRT